MKNLLLIFLLPVFCYGQGDQKIINVPVNGYGGTEKAILHLPDDYSKTSINYPIMVFLHGVGEGGANPASIYNSSSAGGPAYFITQGKFPSSFVNPADGKSYKFIVVSPQANNGWSTYAAQLEYVLSYLFKTYRADASRLYLTGLSAGGEGICEYVGKLDGNNVKVNATHKVAAFIPMSAVMNAGNSLLLANTIISDKVRVWGFGSPTDTHGANTLSLIWYINKLKGNYGVETSYSGGHCCWGQFYDPNFKQNGLSIYQWALQYTQGTSAPPPTVPIANAGPNQTITLPTGQVTLNGSASTVTNGTISKYAWVQKTGPSAARIASATAVSTAVAGLSAGAYTFALTITDNMSKTSTATVQVTVNAAIEVPPPSAGLAIPGKIEAESYSSMSGVATQGTTDAGGGLNVGWIGQRDWMDYKVNVATAGTYTVSFRVATPNPGASFQLKSGSGAVLATISTNSTGGFQTWKTLSAAVTLPAGSQTLQVYCSGAAQWNLNWMQFIINGQPIPGKIEAESYSGMSGVQTQGTTDAGGGLNVGWIGQRDWMDYMVNVAAAGAYTVSFRVATPNSGASFQLRSGSGAVLATISTNSTGGFQTWKTLSAAVTLPAGSQTLRVYCSGTAQWNLNWMQFASGSSAASIQTATVSATSNQTLLTDSAADIPGTVSSFVLYPNPVQSGFMIQLNNEYRGNMRVQIVDVTGVIRQTYSYNKTQSLMQLNLSAGSLSAGIYFVRVQIGAWSETKKMSKL